MSTQQQETNGLTRLFRRLSLAGKFAVSLSVILTFFCALAIVLIYQQQGIMLAELVARAEALQAAATGAASARDIEAAFGEVLSTVTLTLAFMMGFIALGVVALVYVLFLILIRRRLRELEGNFRDISEGEGDLSRRVTIRGNDGIDRLGVHFNRFLGKIHSAVKQVVEATDQLGRTSGEVTAIVRTTSDGVLRQQTEIDQLASAMNQMSATAQEVAHNAQAALEAAEKSQGEALTGREVVNENIAAIRALADGVTQANAVIQRLKDDSGQIGTVLEVIQAIAEQTNLLALNAAIEAARAGEQGRGFAVVADEVRTLSSRTQKSTREIQAVIERLQAGAAQAAQVMDTSREQADASVSQAAKAGTALEGITRAVATIKDMNTQIAAAAEQQTAVVATMDANVGSISQVAGNTAEGARTTAGRSEELGRLAAQLQGLMGQFKV